MHSESCYDYYEICNIEHIGFPSVSIIRSDKPSLGSYYMYAV